MLKVRVSPQVSGQVLDAHGAGGSVIWMCREITCNLLTNTE